MKVFFTLILLLSSNYLFASDVDVIELHETKTLDQLVLEQGTENDQEQNVNLENIEVQENLSEEENLNGEITIQEDNSSNDQKDSSLIENGEIEEVIVDVSNFWESFDPIKLAIYFKNINSINSPPLYNEFIELLTNFNLDINNLKNSKIFYLIINKLVELGEIQKAYNLTKSIQLLNDENLIFYKTLELNFLFSTYQLNEACELKNELNLQQLQLPNYYLEKADIFCLVMKEKSGEANLLNSILIETEVKNDQYFQDLLKIIINLNNDSEKVNLTLPNDYSKNLIFLYSAMLRIAELPLTEKFLQIDPNNLSMPIILSNSTEKSLRLKAANKAYLNNLISIESLSALYQSIDFNSVQLNDPKKTLEELENDNELIMAYYFQLSNIQIFPSDRLNVILNFWKFAESIELEKISYHLTYNIISSIEPSSNNANFGSQLATAFIYNDDFEKAFKWILFAENSNALNQDLKKVKLLYDLYQSQDTKKIIEYINNNYENLINTESAIIKEILHVTLIVLDPYNSSNFNLFFEKVMDDRLMPTIFLNSQIENAIKNNEDSNLFLLILISLNNKQWSEVHPEHLKLVLKGIKNYKNSELLKNSLLDIFENNKVF